MTEVISVKFKNRGKVYFFDPHGIAVRTGEKVVVETSRGLELAECVQGNHAVPDETVVQPLRSLARIATKDDLRIEEINRRREKEAFAICKQKIAEHGLDMKLVDVECSFEGNKTMFFFTSDGRVDFRELVKDLASVFRNRIELRQIGVARRGEDARRHRHLRPPVLLQSVSGRLSARVHEDGEGAVHVAQPVEDLRRVRPSDVLPAL